MAVVEFNWDTVSSLGELNERVIEFLQGKYSTSPWHLAPTAPETVPLLADLIELNAQGYITTQGQPALHVYPVRHYLTKEIVLHNGHKLTNVQYGYVDGLLDTRVYPLDLLIRELSKEPTLCAAIYSYGSQVSHIMNIPTSTDTKDGIYVLTKAIEDDTETVIPETTFRINDVYEFAYEVLDALNDADLQDEVENNCVYVNFVHNIEPTADNPHAGVGLERKLITLLQRVRAQSGAGRSRSKARRSTIRRRRR